MKINFRFSYIIVPLALFIIVTAFNNSFAEKKLTAEHLARQIFDRNRGKTSFSKAIMVLIDKKENKKTRIFTSTRIEKNGFDKQIIRFLSPEDIAGTGFLTIEKQGYETDQFIYLSALRRSRRIVSSQKHHRFVLSDFTYEDMERHPVENYEYRLKEDKATVGIECYQLETRPKPGTESQYSLTEALISKNGYVPIIVKYHDQKGNHVKTYTVLKLEQIQGIWTETIIKMEDHVRSHQTFIKLQHIEYNKEIKDEQLSKAALENP